MHLVRQLSLKASRAEVEPLLNCFILPVDPADMQHIEWLHFLYIFRVYDI